jgi:sulfoxide reductase heme-binding subunit YedZ
MTSAPARTRSRLWPRLFYLLVFCAAATPGVLLGWRTYAGDLGVNPAETLLHETGRDALMVLLASLAVTPIRRLTGWNRVQAVRRMVGVWSFFYALCHFLVYAVFNHLGEVAAIWADVIERPFIFSGMFAFVILVALAATSTSGMVRRLGRNWQRLHRLVYLAAGAGVLHFAWGQKADIREPLLWGSVLAVLLGIRVVLAVRRSSARRAVGVTR